MRDRAPSSYRAAAVFALYAIAILAAGFFTLPYGGREQKLMLVFGLWAIPLTAIAIYLGRPGAAALVRRLAIQPPPWALWVFTGLLLVVLLLIARFGFDAFPNSPDEYAYVIQAQTYALGKLWVPAPPVSDAFQFSQLFFKDGRWFSWYQPGWPLFMTPLVLVKGPLWIVNPLLGAITAPCFYALARQYLDRPAAWLATLTLVLSAYFLFNYASYFTHGAAALAAILSALFGGRYLRSGRWWTALAAGACIGLLGFIRAFNAPFIAAPFVVALLLTPGRRSGLLWFALGGAPFLAALLAYFAAFSGDPLLPVQEWYLPGHEPVGAPSGVSLRETAIRLTRLHFWTSPLVLLGWAWAFAALAVRRHLRFVDFIFPVTVLGFVFYGGHGGWQYGPRYLFEAWPFAVLTALRALEPILLPKPSDGTAAPASGKTAGLVAAALLAHLAYQLAYAPPRLALQHQLIDERDRVYKDVKAHRLKNAVVFIASTAQGLRWVDPLDLTRNGLDPFDNSVVYAVDRGEKNAELLSALPGRTPYLYALGSLRPLPLKEICTARMAAGRPAETHPRC